MEKSSQPRKTQSNAFLKDGDMTEIAHPCTVCHEKKGSHLQGLFHLLVAAHSTFTCDGDYRKGKEVGKEHAQANEDEANTTCC